MADWVISLIRAGGYSAVVVLMFIENVFPPIPSELIMPLVGYMASRGQLTFTGVVVAGAAGSVVGALPLYYLGRGLGEERLKRWVDRHGRWLTVSRSDVERAKHWFDKHGWAADFFCRLVPGIRSLISLPAGISRLNLAGFLLCTTAGATIWTALLASLGYFLGANYQSVEKYLNPVSYFVLGAVVVAYFVRVFRHKGQGREETGG